MWGSSGKRNGEHRPGRIDTLIGQNTEIRGDLIFRGGLHVDGVVKGNVIAADNDSSVLSLSEKGAIEGEVRVPNLVLNGEVHGDVFVSQHVELAPQARITGNVQYNTIEMARGAMVNGKLLHSSDGETLALGKGGQAMLTVDDPAFGDS